MKICAVIVTYGDRFHLLKQVIEACFREGIYNAIVVDNASVKNSRKQLKEYENENKDRLKVIYLDENTGSAGGYKRGLQEAYKCNECEYLLLLDDDNIIEKNFITKLKKWYIKLNKKNNLNYFFVIQAYRNYEYINDFLNGYDYILHQFMYRGFDFFNTFRKRLFKKNKKEKIFFKKKVVEIPVAPYGGMFFNKKILNYVGFPKEELYLYADDFEFSYRISRKYKIYLIVDIVIRDIDVSWEENNKKNKFIYHPFINNGNELKTYYLFRNSDFFECKVLNKKGIHFYFNRNMYILLLLTIGLFNFKFTRIKTIIKAIFDTKDLQ